MKKYRAYTFVSHMICASIIAIVVQIMSSLCPSYAFAGETSIEPVIKGIELMNDGNYDEAIDVFGSVISDNEIIIDFALLWQAEAYFGNGNYKEAMINIEHIKAAYKETAAFKSSLKLEIDICKEDCSDEKRLRDLYNNFSSAFPSEREMRYDYAKVLQSGGYHEEAYNIFKVLYVEAGEFADASAAEIDVSSLSLDDLLLRGNNLLKQWKFSEAEIAFQKALMVAPPDIAEDIKEKIAYCVFSQKDYEKAARLHAELNDKYMEAVSYLRTGQKSALLLALDGLKAMKDPRAGRLIIAIANEKRRNGDYYSAISSLMEASNASPFREEMLWQIGWTHYSSGNYPESEKIFDELYDKYGSSRYRYWMLRSRERLLIDASEDFKDLCIMNDYYGFLACLRNGSEFKKVSASAKKVKIDSPLLKRFGILKSLGFKEEALFELKRLIRKLNKPSEIILYSKKLKEIGEYKKAISVATMVPYDDAVHELWYPIAYWEVISEASSRFSVDPVYILSIAREESRLDPEARSVAGAVGLMQLMPETAKRMCTKIKCSMEEKDPLFDVETNIILGSYYLKILLNRFESIPLATAAYNAGENVVQRWLNTYGNREPDEFIEDIPYTETRNYVKKVMTTLFQYSRSLDRPQIYMTLQNDISVSFNLLHAQ